MGFVDWMPASHKAIQKTVGDGKPGPKTLALRVDREAIGKAGFYFPDHVSFTPKFFQRFLWESKALSAVNSAEAKERIMKTEFSPEEKKEIEGAINSFKEGPFLHLMVRSDEHAMGVGVWHSGAASVTSTDFVDPEMHEQLTQLVENQMRMVLASDFGGEVQLFKEKKGISGNPGVIIMPLFGEAMGGRRYEVILTPPISINYLGKIDGKALISVGAGLGGANKVYAAYCLGDRVPLSSFLGDRIAIRRSWDVIVEDGGKIALDNISGCLETCYEQRMGDPKEWDSINMMINDLIQEVGPRYLEIVKDDAQRPHWVVVQSAPFEIRSIKKPGIDPESIVMKTKQVVGTKIVKTEKVRLANVKPTSEDFEYNQKNKGYLLIIETPYAGMLERSWDLSLFSNAVAIILYVGVIRNPLRSHLRGLYRELGIPVLVSNNLGKFIKSLEKQPNQDLSCTVYANEFAQEGFLAIDKKTV